MYIAVDVGGTKTLVAVFNEDGTVIRQEKNPTNPDYQKFIDETVEVVLRLQKDEEAEVIAVGIPAHVEYDDGRAKEFGNLDWHDVDIKKDLRNRFSVPVIADNDANMGALGEANLGVGQNHRVCLYVTISTGIGTGITAEGKIDEGLRESEGGQMVFEHEGELRPWETFASGSAFYHDYGKQGKDVDDPNIWKEYASKVGIGIHELIAVIQPDIVIIGGSMGVHLPKYEDFLKEYLYSVTGSNPVVDLPPIAQARFPENAVLNGCYLVARRYAETY